MSYRAHIVVADKGWILEKLAIEIAKETSHITYGTEYDSCADIQYYMNYSSRKNKRISSLEVAFFTHSEITESARKHFLKTASEVDHCICMSQRYADELNTYGISHTSIISPGVNFETYVPRIRIGVVGRTYHTGRKGESLVSQVMDIPDIEWRFTGEGWPGTALNIPDNEMPAFYNDLDYVLIPSLYEGGPMCMIEGLACGVPIIASDVGWVNEFPHIPFKNGDAASLREVLIGLVSERFKLRNLVKDQTWSNWRDKHLMLFDCLMNKAKECTAITTSAKGKRLKDSKILLFTHGTEGTTLGGPSIRVPRTAMELNKIGVPAVLSTELPENYGKDVDICHIYNIWPPKSCYKTILRAQEAEKKIVFSPIFLNLSHYALYSQRIPAIYNDFAHSRKIERILRSIRDEMLEADNVLLKESFIGYHELVRSCLAMANHIVFLSEYEKRCIQSLGGEFKQSTIIHNPVSAELFSDADSTLFKNRYDLDKYILCVGRIESRKNQLSLAYAARELGIPVVFIGHSGDEKYAALVRKIAGEQAVFISRLSQSASLFKSAFAGASVFCLPSWAEGAPLAALEAAVAGIPLVLSDQSSEIEYFGKYAKYIHPADLQGICLALEMAISHKEDEQFLEEQRNHFKSNFSWESHIQKTTHVYEKLLQDTSSAVPPDSIKVNISDKPIYFDITTSVHHPGTPTGIMRVERELYLSLSQVYPRIIPIAWISSSRNFVEVSHSLALEGVNLKTLEQMEKNEKIKIAGMNKNVQKIIISGSAWISNSRYSENLYHLRRKLDAHLIVHIFDLLQLEFSYLYPKGTAIQFNKRLRTIIENSDQFLVQTNTTKEHLLSYLRNMGEIFKKVTVFRYGDTSEKESLNDCKQNSIDKNEFTPQAFNSKYILYVSSLDIRKNHHLLINIWRRLSETRLDNMPHILFVGRKGYRAEEIIAAIQNDQILSQFVHHLPDIDDSQLCRLYAECLFTVYPSLGEGYGLPISESLSFGKFCLTSDRSSMREIAPDLTELIDPYDFKAWLERIIYYYDNPDAVTEKEKIIADKYMPGKWTDAAKVILDAINESQYHFSNCATIFPNEFLSLTKDVDNNGFNLCNGTWNVVEGKGITPSCPGASLIFRYAGDISKTVSIRLRVHTRSSQEEIVQISAHGRPSVSYAVFPQEKDITLRIEPSMHVTPSSIISLHFNSDSFEQAVQIIVAGIIVSSEMSESPAHMTNSPVSSQIDVEKGISRCVPLIDVTSNQRTRHLTEALNCIRLPDRLAPLSWKRRFLRFFLLDKIIIKIYMRVFAKTNNAIKNIVDAIEKQ